MDTPFLDEKAKLFFREGEIAYLRPLLKQDLRIEYLSWLNNPELNHYSAHFRTWPTIEKDLEEFFDNIKSKNHIVFATCCKKTGKHFGNCSLDNIDWVNSNAQFNINIGIKEYRGMHFFDILNIISEYCFNTLNLNKITGGAEIPGMMKIKKRLGWKRDGILRQHSFRNGSYHDVELYSLLRDDYFKMNKKIKEDKV